jgi:hypothetical protein
LSGAFSIVNDGKFIGQPGVFFDLSMKAAIAAGSVVRGL